MLQQPDAATAAVAATAVTVGGVAVGLDYAVLLAGFAGGLVSLSFLPAMSVWRRIWTPVTATLTGGYTAPLGVHYLQRLLGDSVVPDSLELFSAFATGVAAQFIIPVAINAARERAEKKARKESSP